MSECMNCGGNVNAEGGCWCEREEKLAAECERLRARCAEYEHDAGALPYMIDECKRLRARVALLEGELAPLRESVTYADVRKALGDLSNGEASFGRLVEIMRAAVATQLAQARAEATAEERERAARIADGEADDPASRWCTMEGVAKAIAAAIRAGGQKT